MVKAILGRKLRMTQMFTTDGRIVPLTAIQVGPCPIVQIKTAEKEGYNALQIGFMPVKEKSLNQPLVGHFKKTGSVEPHRFLKEIRVETVDGFEIGQTLGSSEFDEGDHVDVSGVSKGRGFQGGIRRHGWHGGRMSHGSMFHRRIGSNAPGSGQSRIFKGKTMPGHMGAENVTMQNLEVMRVDAENNIVYVRGGIPGPNGGLVFVKQTTKNKPTKKQAK